MLMMGFPRRLCQPGELVTVETAPEIPVYLEGFVLPAGLSDLFHQIDEVQVGETKLGPLVLAFQPDNPRAAYATPMELVRVRAGEAVKCTLASMASMGYAPAMLRLAAIVRADGEVRR